jgi:hypothetical protein
MMKYKRPIESLFNLRSYDEVAESRIDDSVQLRLEDPSGRSDDPKLNLDPPQSAQISLQGCIPITSSFQSGRFRVVKQITVNT